MVDWSENKLLKGLSLYQIFCGIPGLGMLLWNLIFSTSFSLDLWTAFFLLMILSMNLVTIASGYFLLLNKVKWGGRLAFLSQGLQLIAFSISGFTYFFSNGINLLINLNFTRGFRIGFDFSLFASSFSFAMGNGNSEAALISINIIPILFIYFLEKAIKSKSADNAH